MKRIGTLAVAAITLVAGASGANAPAADAAGLEFFVKAAQYREVPAGLAEASAAALEQAARFLFSDAGMDAGIRDESGKKVPPYIYHAVIDDDNRFSYRISYPAYHHAYLIEAFLNYFNYSGNAEASRRARELADLTIAHKHSNRLLVAADAVEHLLRREARWPGRQGLAAARRPHIWGYRMSGSTKSPPKVPI